MAKNSLPIKPFSFFVEAVYYCWVSQKPSLSWVSSKNIISKFLFYCIMYTVLHDFDNHVWYNQLYKTAERKFFKIQTWFYFHLNIISFRHHAQSRVKNTLAVWYRFIKLLLKTEARLCVMDDFNIERHLGLRTFLQIWILLSIHKDIQ